MKNRRGFKYYLRFYAFAVIAYLGYVSFLAYQDGGYDVNLLFSVGYLPLLFIVFMYVFDSIIDKIIPDKKRKVEDEYSEFLKTITKTVNEKLDLSIEDFRRLRVSEKFQKSLFHAYKISKDGETTDLNFKLLEKKYKKDTREYKAILVVTEEVKKMMVN